MVGAAANSDATPLLLTTRRSPLHLVVKALGHSTDATTRICSCGDAAPLLPKTSRDRLHSLVNGTYWRLNSRRRSTFTTSSKYETAVLCSKGARPTYCRRYSGPKSRRRSPLLLIASAKQLYFVIKAPGRHNAGDTLV